MTKSRCEGQPRASEAKGPLPAEEGWVMEKKEKRKRVKELHPAQWAYLFSVCGWAYLFSVCGWAYKKSSKPTHCAGWVVELNVHSTINGSGVARNNF
jgi:hypothetical protein